MTMIKVELTLTEREGEALRDRIPEPGRWARLDERTALNKLHEALDRAQAAAAAK